MVVVIIGNVDVILPEILLNVIGVLIPADLDEAVLILDLGLDNLLLGESADALRRGSWADQTLLFRVFQVFVVLY